MIDYSKDIYTKRIVRENALIYNRLLQIYNAQKNSTSKSFNKREQIKTVTNAQKLREELIQRENIRLVRKLNDMTPSATVSSDEHKYFWKKYLNYKKMRLLSQRAATKASY